MLARIRFLLHLTRSQGIVRRYMVTNGFDGALTMLGLITGFYVSGNEDLGVAISACAGAAIALAVSGLTSAYVSESAERRKELRELEHAMVTDLDESAHARAARLVPILIALVNALAPLLISLLIILPLWLGRLGIWLPLAPLESAVFQAFVMIFLLGVFIGKVSGEFWLWSGLRTLLIALFTATLILLLDPGNT
jgi:predicted membrane protein (TIGR00267 family)